MTARKTVPLLEADNVAKRYKLGNPLFGSGRRFVHAVDGVSFAVARGETLGLVGESGCGKSTLGRCLTRLYDPSAGRILFDGTDIAKLGPRALKPFRARMQMVFQDPAASLNPRRRIGEVLAEPLTVHRRGSRQEIAARIRALLDEVGLAADMAGRFPHEFSGGQRQRIGIARALALEPELIVADEPVSALDVSVQAQIVNLFMDLQTERGLTYIFIAHDLSVVRQISTRVAVMYLGSIVEIGPTESVLGSPAHPYTQALISAVPVPDPNRPQRQRIILEGDVPSPVNPPSGCRFHPRCRFATDLCRTKRPVLDPRRDGGQVACHYPLAAPADTGAASEAGIQALG